jgi:hypothetical protein
MEPVKKSKTQRQFLYESVNTVPFNVETQADIWNTVVPVLPSRTKPTAITTQPNLSQSTPSYPGARLILPSPRTPVPELSHLKPSRIKLSTSMTTISHVPHLGRAARCQCNTSKLKSPSHTNTSPASSLCHAAPHTKPPQLTNTKTHLLFDNMTSLYTIALPFLNAIKCLLFKQSLSTSHIHMRKTTLKSSRTGTSRPLATMP